MPASQLTEKEQELNVFMEKALVDRRQLAEKYKEARDKLKQLEQLPSVVSCRLQRCLQMVLPNIPKTETSKRCYPCNDASFGIQIIETLKSAALILWSPYLP